MPGSYSLIYARTGTIYCLEDFQARIGQHKSFVDGSKEHEFICSYGTLILVFRISPSSLDSAAVETKFCTNAVSREVVVDAGQRAGTASKGTTKAVYLALLTSLFTR